MIWVRKILHAWLHFSCKIWIQNFLRKKKIVRIIYFPIIFPDKVDNIKIHWYICWNRAFWEHACEPRRARHMRVNVTRTCVISWVHPSGLILTRACVMPCITQTFCFLGIHENGKVLNFIERYLQEKKRYLKNSKRVLMGKSGTFRFRNDFLEKELIRDVI